MSQVSDFIKRAAQTVGLKRELYVERDIPTVTSDIVVIPFWGDLRSTFILSSFIIPRIKEMWKEKYVILCSWPGMHGLFPCVNEYWTLQEESSVGLLATGADNFYNASELSTNITRELLEHFSHVMRSVVLGKYYRDGFQKNFWDEFKEIKCFLPEVASVSRISANFKDQVARKPGKKIVIYPVKRIRSWQKDKNEYVNSPPEFWNSLVEGLLKEDVTPLVYQNAFTYDLSKEFAERCLYMVPRDITDVLPAMRYVGCVLDVFSGISRWAIAARTPFICVDERKRFMRQKDYEIDDLCCKNIPKKYMFSFGGYLLSGDEEEWKISLTNGIVAKVRNFLPTLDKTALPPTTESYETIPFGQIRDRMSKRMGVRFLNTSKNK
jgi:hypothetical protein